MKESFFPNALLKPTTPPADKKIKIQISPKIGMTLGRPTPSPSKLAFPSLSLSSPAPPPPPPQEPHPSTLVNGDTANGYTMDIDTNNYTKGNESAPTLDDDNNNNNNNNSNNDAFQLATMEEIEYTVTDNGVSESQAHQLEPNNVHINNTELSISQQIEEVASQQRTNTNETDDSNPITPSKSKDLTVETPSSTSSKPRTKRSRSKSPTNEDSKRKKREDDSKDKYRSKDKDDRRDRDRDRRSDHRSSSSAHSSRDRDRDSRRDSGRHRSRSRSRDRDARRSDKDKHHRHSTGNSDKDRKFKKQEEEERRKQIEFQKALEEKLKKQEEEKKEEERTQQMLEESRRRREEILKKYQQQQSNGSQQQTSPTLSAQLTPSVAEPANTLPTSQANIITTTPSVNKIHSSISENNGNTHQDYSSVSTPTAANKAESLPKDVHPTTETDDMFDLTSREAAFELLEQELHHKHVQSQKSTKKDDFDMFSDSPVDTTGETLTWGANVTEESGGINNAFVKTANGNLALVQKEANNGGRHLNDNWDDTEGYYVCRVGEIINQRYQILGAFGKGMFSNVLRAKDLLYTGDNNKQSTKSVVCSTPTPTGVPPTPQTPQVLGMSPVSPSSSFMPGEVAIKVIRNNDMLYRAGQNEIRFLELLADRDKEDRKHVIRLLSKFEFRNHLCLVFEPMKMNLREVLRKFGHEHGKPVGINIRAVKIYTRQLLISLKHLMACEILHADIKPDNILLANDQMNTVKLSDLGSASFVQENDITPYLVSRFYRAPEIILGHRYSYPIDMWSLGCTIFELYTGKILFPGITNNQMLRLFQEIRGPFSKKMIKNGQFGSQHFDQDTNFISQERDPVTKAVHVRRMVFTKPTRDMKKILLSCMQNASSEEERRDVLKLNDLLEKMLALDPLKRITPAQALLHEFLLK